MSNVNAHRAQILANSTRNNLGSFSQFFGGNTPNIGSGTKATFGGTISRQNPFSSGFGGTVPHAPNPVLVQSVRSAPPIPRQIVVGPIVKGKTPTKVTPVAGRLYPL